MKYCITAFILWFVSQQGFATDEWSFSDKIAISSKPASGVFHHLDGAGRKHIALSSELLAVCWEDNHTEDPQIYVAFKSDGINKFSAVLQVSGGLEAYEPVIVGVPGSKFILAWEQDGAVYARTLINQKLTTPVKLSNSTASHVSLASYENKVFAVWREQQSRTWNIQTAKLNFDSAGELTVVSKNPILSKSVSTPVLFPSLVFNQAGLTVAWEDRESGHTRLKYSFSADNDFSFSKPEYLNEFFSNRNEYDKGSGVTRVSLASYAEDEVVAAWMDKRRGGAGYGIYTAQGSEDAFGPNEKIHGKVGDTLPHYNPATSGNRAGGIVVAWDDFRLGNSDIWLSSYNDEDEWSKNFSPAPASGVGEQSHPSVFLDDQGRLHLLWVEREEINGPTRLWYSRGEPG